MSEIVKCELCGEPMPSGEEMFNYHGFSGPCPTPKEKPCEQNAPGVESAGGAASGESYQSVNDAMKVITELRYRVTLLEGCIENYRRQLDSTRAALYEGDCPICHGSDKHCKICGM